MKYFKTNITYENKELTKKRTEQHPQRHQEAVREIAIAPTDEKFVTCSDDKTLKIWDFHTASVDKTLEGHGSDVTTVDWHPSKSLIVSAGKDRVLKFWDPKNPKNFFNFQSNEHNNKHGMELCSLYNHTNTITKVIFNNNGNWVLSCGRDQVVKLFDLRVMKEICNFKSHSTEVISLAWHP